MAEIRLQQNALLFDRLGQSSVAGGTNGMNSQSFLMQNYRYRGRGGEMHGAFTKSPSPIGSRRRSDCESSFVHLRKLEDELVFKDREIEHLKCRIAHDQCYGGGSSSGGGGNLNTQPNESFDFNPYYMEETSPVKTISLY